MKSFPTFSLFICYLLGNEIWDACGPLDLGKGNKIPVSAFYYEFQHLEVIHLKNHRPC
jgi:hypothetical protein